MKHVFFLAVLLVTLTTHAQDDIVKKGQALPAFAITSNTGNVIDAASSKHKVVLLNFFATWCGPRLTELPILQAKIWEKYKNKKNFTLLVIGRDHSDAEIQTFKERSKFDLPMFPDKDKVIYALFATKYIPRNYLIDKDGKVVYLSTGYEEKEFAAMAKKLDEILK